MTIEGAVNTYNVLKENDFKITGESLLSAGTTLLSAAATVAGFKALGSSVRETTALIRSGAACFTAGTLVLTENGQKAIEDIQAGDKVYATDPETGESGYKEVLQTFEKETEVVVHVTYEKDGEGSNAETTTVNTTLNHRFWTEDGWKSAGTLEAGDKLTLADGNTATVTNIAYEDTHATVYNFEVEDFHTYYVGTESVLVHNNGGNCMKTASALAQGGSKTSYGKSSGKYDTTADFLTNIENRNGKFYTDKATIDKIGQVEARREDFSLLNKRIMSSRASTEGGTSVVYKYSDELGTKYLIHEVTDARGYIIHRDFDAVRISSGQLINKGH